MHIKVVLVAGLLGALQLIVPPAHAAGRLEVAGDRSASADVTFATSTRLQPEAVTATVRGSYAILHIERYAPIDEAIDIVIAFLPAAVGGGRGPVDLGAGDTQLPAGRYRISLLTDGPAAIQVPATGGAAGLRVRPARTVDPKVMVFDVPVDQSTPVTWGALSRLPVRPGTWPLLVYATLFEYADEPIAAYDFDICVVPRGDSCSDGNPLYGTRPDGVLVEQHTERRVGYASRDQVTAGADYDVVTEYSGLMEPRTLRSFLLAVDLPATPVSRPSTTSQANGTGANKSDSPPLPATGAELPLTAALAAFAGAATCVRSRRTRDGLS